jgi:hypothetical protein
MSIPINKRAGKFAGKIQGCAIDRRRSYLGGGVDEFVTLQSGECLNGPSCLFLSEP